MLITETPSIHLAPAGTRERTKSQQWWQQARNGHARAFYLYVGQRKYVLKTWAKPTTVPELCFEIGSIRGAAARKHHHHHSRVWL